LGHGVNLLAVSYQLSANLFASAKDSRDAAGGLFLFYREVKIRGTPARGTAEDGCPHFGKLRADTC